uniref:Uncharacterized protein n=1 Tax=Arion vulgaris TaxID=1028688 RepID=A0A0B7B8I2_9EUPU
MLKLKFNDHLLSMDECPIYIYGNHNGQQAGVENTDRQIWGESKKENGDREQISKHQ